MFCYYFCRNSLYCFFLIFQFLTFLLHIVLSAQSAQLLLSFFFLENAGELRFIALEREKGPHTTSDPHTGTKYERSVILTKTS